MKTEISIAQIVHCTAAEGPGKRFALWFQGCPLRCKGCCNPEMLPFEGGLRVSVDEVMEQIREAVGSDGIEGITLLGGEPLAHAEGAAELARRVQQEGLSVMVFSGFTLAEARGMGDAVQALLADTDILVDGRYEEAARQTPSLRWVGSTNQVVHFLTQRYRADDPRWRERNTMELRMEKGAVVVNGFPAASAVGFWKRGRR